MDVAAGTQMVRETSVIFNHMTRLIAQKGFIDARRREGFRSYIFWNK
jgi:hypothetical protein